MDELGIGHELGPPSGRRSATEQVVVLGVHEPALVEAPELLPGGPAHEQDGSDRGLDRPRLGVIPMGAEPWLQPVRHEPRQAGRTDQLRQRGRERHDAWLQGPVLVAEPRHDDADAGVGQRGKHPVDAAGPAQEGVAVDEQITGARQRCRSALVAAGVAEVLVERDDPHLGQRLGEHCGVAAAGGVVDDDDSRRRHSVAAQGFDRSTGQLGRPPVEDDRRQLVSPHQGLGSAPAPARETRRPVAAP